MVEGAPMRFPGGTFFQIRGFVLGLGRQVHQGTDGTLDACQSQTPGKQKCARDFPCSRFQYPQKIHGTFFFRGHGSGCPGTEQGCAPFLAAPAIQEGRFFVRVRAAYVIQKYFPRGRFEMQLRGSRSLAVCYCSRFRNPSCDFQSSSAGPQRMVKKGHAGMGMPDFPFGNGFAFPFQDNRRSAAVGEPFRLDVIRFKRGASAPAGGKSRQDAGQ